MLIALLGPTASGKTHLAVELAYTLGGEIISADSRQLYRRMDIGTGKDLSEYVYNGQPIAYHLIDVLEPGEQCNLFAYQQMFYEVYEQLSARHTPMILCGGSGMYAEALLRNYALAPVAPDRELREKLEMLSDAELTAILATHQTLHNSTDTSSRKRLIRAVEIALANPETHKSKRKGIESLIFAIDLPQQARWQRIEKRLKVRLDAGLIEEVQSLLNEGIAPENLIYYGLEYKFVTLYLLGEIATRDALFTQLNIAIRQFAKRQMTYLRGMERRGLCLHWLNGLETTETLLTTIRETIRQYGSRRANA